MKPYLKEIINNLKISGTWKIQLTITITFISSKDTDEECIVYSKSDDVEIMIKNKTVKVIKEHFESLLSTIWVRNISER